MRVAILADIHANNNALQAVLNKIQDLRVDALWFLGDIVDRGPDPVETLAWLRDNVHKVDGHRWVMGNHDAMLANLLKPQEWDRVHDVHVQDNLLHKEILGKENDLWEFVEQTIRPEMKTPVVVGTNSADFILSHSGQHDPLGIFRRLYSWSDPSVYLEPEFTTMNSILRPRVLLVGHTHVPTLISGRENADTPLGMDIHAEMVVPCREFPLNLDMDWIINPGSVGQPRDLDQRAAFAVLDTDRMAIVFHRVEYDWRSVARRLLKHGHHESYVDVLKDATPDPETPETWLAHYKRAAGEDC